MKDLHVAMSGDAALLTMVENFAASRTGGEWFSDAAAVRGEVADILLAWAGVTGPVAGFEHGVFGKMEEYLFLRKWAGNDSPYTGTWFGGTPFLPCAADGVDAINKSWDNVLDLYTARLVFQAGGSALFGGSAVYDPWTDTFTGTDIGLSQTAIGDLQTAAAAAGDKEAFWHSVAKLIDGVMGTENLTATETGWLDDAIDASTSGAHSWTDIAATLSVHDISVTDNADTITGTQWDDRVGISDYYGYSNNGGDDTISGGGGNDTLWGGVGNDALYGGVGNDTLLGSTGNDYLSGGAGNDILDGYMGNDTYFYESGNDVFREFGGNFYTDTDIVVFDAGIAPGDVSLHLARIDAGNALQLIVMVDGRGSITIPYNLATYAPYSSLIDELHFSDSTVLTIANMPITVHGTSSSDDINLWSFNGILTYDTGAGNDIIQETGTNNTFYVMGGGSDRITDYGGSDTVVIPAGYDAGDVHLYRTATPSGYFYDFKVSVDGLGDATFLSHFNGATNRVESIKFLSDNSTINIADQVITTLGTSAGDYIPDGITTGGSINDIILGLGGNDWISSGDGNDTVEGGAGDDTMYGGTGTDTLSYAGAGSAVTVNLATASAQNTGGAGTDTISGFENLTGSAYNDTLTGTSGDNILLGGLGNDSYYYTGGTDTIADTGGSDTIYLPGTVELSELTFFRYSTAPGDLRIHIYDSYNTDLVIIGQLVGSATHVETLNIGYDIALDQVYVATLGTGGSEVIYGITFGARSEDTFDDVFDADDIIYAGAGQDSIFAGGGNDAIDGGDGGDGILGEQGNDTIYGGNGNDFIFGDGDGTETYSGTDTIYGDAGNDWIEGGGGADQIHGGNDDDVLFGQAGNDLLYGDAGNDSIVGGDGNDMIYGGAGADTLYGESGADTFVFEAATAASGVDTIMDFMTGSGNDKIDLSDILTAYNPGTHQIEDFVQFATSGSNTIVSVDANGATGGTTWTQIATISGVTGITDEAALVASGNLVV